MNRCSLGVKIPILENTGRYRFPEILIEVRAAFLELALRKNARRMLAKNARKSEEKLRIVSPPWCLGAGSSTARVASPAKAEPPPKFWRITVSCKEDIQLVEHKLRRLYGTIDGQGCQALLTTEYQQWKNTVLRHFLNHSGDAAGVRLLDASLSDNV
jgi:hypothetical protein